MHRLFRLGLPIFLRLILVVFVVIVFGNFAFSRLIFANILTAAAISQPQIVYQQYGVLLDVVVDSLNSLFHKHLLGCIQLFIFRVIITFLL